MDNCSISSKSHPNNSHKFAEYHATFDPNHFDLKAFLVVRIGRCWITNRDWKSKNCNALACIFPATNHRHRFSFQNTGPRAYSCCSIDFIELNSTAISLRAPRFKTKALQINYESNYMAIGCELHNRSCWNRNECEHFRRVYSKITKMFPIKVDIGRICMDIELDAISKHLSILNCA